MTERMIELVLDESKWLATAMLLSITVVAVRFNRKRREGLSRRLEIVWAMNLFYGSMLGVMSAGHLLAVTIKSLQGTLGGSPWFLYPLGIVLAVPAWWLVLRVDRFVTNEERWRGRTLALNAWLGISLLALGLHNWPLAATAGFNIAYQLHSRRAVGRMIMTVMIAANLALFAGSLVFFASGQSFEQLKGM